MDVSPPCAWNQHRGCRHSGHSKPRSPVLHDALGLAWQEELRINGESNRRASLFRTLLRVLLPKHIWGFATAAAEVPSRLLKHSALSYLG